MDENFMVKVEITNEILEEVAESLYNMEISAKSIFDELFPNLDFEKDFLDNERFIDIEYLFESVETVVDERGYEHYGALYNLLEWTLEGLLYELFSEGHIVTIRNFNENEVAEFISWLQENGASYEEAQDPEHQIENLDCFLNERRGY